MRMGLSSTISNRPVRFTKAGWWFLLAVLLTGIAAYHSANNVLFLGLSFLLSGLLLNGLISWWNFSRLKFRDLRADQSRVGVQSAIVVDMLDSKTILPSYGLIAVVEVVSPSGEVRWMRRFVRRRGGERHIRVAVNWSPVKRGLHQIRLVRVESTFPFGLILKTYPLKLSTQALVWPMKVDVSGERDHSSACYRDPVVVKRTSGPTMDEIEGLRDYRKGDPMRHIHWRKTAQSRNPVVKVGRSEQGKQHYRLAFDFSKSHFMEDAEVDVYCGYVGSLAEWHLASGKGLDVQLHNADPFRIGSDASWMLLMDDLAVIEPSDEPIAVDLIMRSGFTILSPVDVILKRGVGFSESRDIQDKSLFPKGKQSSSR